MRLCWGTHAVLLLAIWPLAGCHQLPSGKSVQDLPEQQQKVNAPPPQLTAAEIFQTHMAQAEHLQRQNNVPEAIALCEKMRELGNPYAWQATWKIAQICENDPNFLHRAEDEYNLLLQHDPGNADLIVKIGDIWARRNQWNAAEREYSKALKYQPNHVAARHGAAFALAKIGDFERSLNEYAKLLPPADAYCAVAAVLAMDQKHRESLQWYQTALQQDPNSERAKHAMLIVQKHLAANPPVDAAKATPEPKGQKGSVDLEEAPTLVIDGNARSIVTQPTLAPLPPIELPRENEREWKTSGKRN